MTTTCSIPLGPTSCGGPAGSMRQPSAYRRARDLTDNTVEQSFLGRRLDELAASFDEPGSTVSR